MLLSASIWLKKLTEHATVMYVNVWIMDGGVYFLWEEPNASLGEADEN